jgi:HD-GYP domain-containing protein (c-di-GMP phosphodiesterase class II)
LLALRFVTVDIAGTVAIILLYGFVRRFPGRTQIRISRLSAVLLIPLAIKYALVASRIIAPYGPAIYLVHLTLAVGIVVNISMLVHRYRDTTEGGRRRLRWMFTGIGLSLVPYLLYLLFNIFKSSILVSSISVINSVASFSILLFPIFVIIGVVRYNLFDIDRFINRFVSIFFLVFISTIMYSVVFMFFFETRLNMEMYLVLLFTALVSPWAFFTFDKLVYSMLWKGRKDPAQILLEMEQELNGVVRREDIYPIVSSALVFAFDPVGLAFAKSDDGLAVEDFRYGKLSVAPGNEAGDILSFPLNTSNGQDMVLYVGRKRDEDIFTRKDTQLLTSAAAQIAKAMDNCDLYHRLEESLANELLAQKTAILTLAKLTEYRDQETGRHLERIQDYSRLIAKKLQETGVGPDYLTDDYIEDLCISSILHDIGKVGVPDVVLLKPGKLSESEFTMIKTHPVIGGRVLEDAEAMNPDRSFLSLGKTVAFHHHEKWDGSGYPDGLAGEAIPLSARIVAIADVYDALRSERPYKSAMSHSDSLDIIIEGRGKHFDPVIVDAFLDIEETIRTITR